MSKRALKRRHYRYGIRQFWYGPISNNYKMKRRDKKCMFYLRDEYCWRSYYKRSWPR